jgi:hypothetical protein
MKAEHFSDDTNEFLFFLYKHRVRYLIIGGEAVIFYGHIRLTGDIGFFYDPAKENAEKLFKALCEFWDGQIPGIVNHEDLLEPEIIFQFGRPPNRLDLLNSIGNISFSNAWNEKKEVQLENKNDSFPIYYIGLNHLIQNKQEANRDRDREDLKFLLKIKET